MEFLSLNERFRDCAVKAVDRVGPVVGAGKVELAFRMGCARLKNWGGGPQKELTR